MLLPKVELFTIKFNGYRVWEVKENNFPTDRPISVKQGRVRGNKNISKVGLRDFKNAPFYILCLFHMIDFRMFSLSFFNLLQNGP